MKCDAIPLLVTKALQTWKQGARHWESSRSRRNFSGCQVQPLSWAQRPRDTLKWTCQVFERGGRIQRLRNWLRSLAHGPISEVANVRRSSSPASHAARMPGAQAGGRRVPAPGVRWAKAEPWPRSAEGGMRMLSWQNNVSVRWWFSSQRSRQALLRHATASYQESPCAWQSDRALRHRMSQTSSGWCCTLTTAVSREYQSFPCWPAHL